MALAYGFHSEPILCSMLLQCFSIPFHLKVCFVESFCRFPLVEVHVYTHTGRLDIFPNIQFLRGNVAFIYFQKNYKIIIQV